MICKCFTVYVSCLSSLTLTLTLILKCKYHPRVMDSQTDSEDSVIESNMLNEHKLQVLGSSSPSNSQSRKDQFHGFYKTQLTIAVDSTNSSIDTENQAEENPNDPTDEDTENTHFQFEGVLDAMKELKIPKIVKNFVEFDDEDDEYDDEDGEHHKMYMERADTSEDEISEIVNDSPLVSNILSRSVSEESLISVSDIDYYKIRHETHFHNERRISLVLAPYHLITKIKSFDDGDADTPYHHPCIPSVKVLVPSDLVDDGADTSDEDFNCNESDFMSLAEFMEAYQTNIDLGKNDVNLQISHSVHHERRRSEDMEEPSTESLDDLEDSESDREAVADISKDPDWDLETVEHSLGCVNRKTRHSQDCRYRKGDSFYTGQGFIIQTEAQLHQAEFLSEDERTSVLELTEASTEMTDEEAISDLEQSNSAPDIKISFLEVKKCRGKGRLKKRANKNKKKKNETNN